MGTVIIGKCQCQCYINYVSCDCNCQENEITTQRRVNRFTENDQKKRKTKKSVGDSAERLSIFSSTRKPSSRSSSQRSKYLLSEYCNVVSDESSRKKAKRKLQLNTQIIKSRKIYNFQEMLMQVDNQQFDLKKVDHIKSTLEQNKKSLIPKNKSVDIIRQEPEDNFRPFKKANQYQQLFFK